MEAAKRKSSHIEEVGCVRGELVCFAGHVAELTVLCLSSFVS